MMDTSILYGVSEKVNAALQLVAPKYWADVAPTDKNIALISEAAAELGLTDVELVQFQYCMYWMIRAYTNGVTYGLVNYDELMANGGKRNGKDF